MLAQQSTEATVEDVEGKEDKNQSTAPKKKKKKKKLTATTSAVIGATLAAHVFKIEELAVRIVTHLLAMSPESVAALAITCRALEAPALMVLWEKEDSLGSLIERVLPWDIQCYVSPHYDSDLSLLVSPHFSPSQHPACSLITTTQQSLQRLPTPWELNRLKRYASWMRRLKVHK